MSLLGKTNHWLIIHLCGLVFASLALFFPAFSQPTYAIDQTNPSTQPTETESSKNQLNSSDKTPSESESQAEPTNVCQDQASALGWLICPGTGVITKAIDSIYNIISDFLVIDPITTNHESPIRIIWEFARNLTNVVFIIFILIIVYSQITGLGINNYGIKRTLPRIIIAAILVNLSFILCSAAVDISNIVGSSIHSFFQSVQKDFVAHAASDPNAKLSFSDLFLALTGGTATVGLLTSFSGGLGALFWLLLPIIIGALISIVIGLITISLRQAAVALLIMISPLAFVAYLLPNTENYFSKWRKLFTQMLIFYPVFSLLFSASSLAGLTIIFSAKNAFYIILGMAVQVLPLFLSVNLMKMSGTILGTVSNKLNNLASRPQAALQNYSASRRDQAKLKHRAESNSAGAALRNYLNYRDRLRAEHSVDHQKIIDSRTTLKLQKKFSSGRTVTTEGPTKANRYTKTRKLASTLELAASAAAQDTDNILNNYGDNYHEPDKVNSNNFEDLQRGSLSQQGAYHWVNYNRAMFTKISNDEADQDFLVDQYIKFAKEGVNSHAYRKYHVSAAGGLGPKGAETVFGQLIARAAAVEARRRHDTNILHKKFGFDQESFRDMAHGYLVTPDGWAADQNHQRLTDEHGNYLEKYRNELIHKDPSKLVLYDKIDPELGPYNDIYDKNDGKFVMRVYRNDSAYMKEALSNFDMSINDPINRSYAVLSGIQSGDIGDGDERYKYIGLGKLSTTIGSSLLLNSFKEKSAAFTPFLASMVSKGLIKNGQHLIAAEMMSMNASSSPSIIRSQDKDAFNTENSYLKMAQEDISQLFTEAGMSDFRDVLGNELTGLDVGENGNKIDIPADQATWQQKLNKLRSVVDKNAKVLENAIENYNINTADRLKMGAAEKVVDLANTLQNYVDADKISTPFDQSTDVFDASRQLKRKRHHNNPNQTTPQNINDLNTISSVVTDIDELYRNNPSDRNSFINASMQLFNQYGLREQAEAFQTYVNTFPNDTIDQIYNTILSEILT